MLSASILMVELLLTRLFSVILFYHSAFLVVALAMMGLGGGGLLVYLNRRRFAPEALPGWLTGLGTAMALLTPLVLFVTLNLNVPARAGWDAAWRLIMLFLVASLPFFLGGALLSLLVWRFAAQIHRIYFYDLAGAALGSLAVLPALTWVGAPNAVLIAAALSAASALLLGWATGASRARLRVCGSGVAALVFLFLTNLQGNLLDLRYAKGESTSSELYARWNAISRVCVHSTAAVYYIRIDCDAATGVPAFDFWRADRREIAKRFASRGEDLAHLLHPNAKTLVIGSGGGRDVARALAHGSPRVVAVEINPLIARDLMLGFLREDSRRLFERPEVELVVDDARSAVQRATEQFEVIQATLIDTWASTAAGAFALTESYLYTVEAFEVYLRHLSPEGILSVTRWEFVPPRQAIRVVSLGRAALERMGVRDSARHFLVVEEGPVGKSRASVLIKRTPFTDEEIARARAFLAANPAVRATYLPDLPEANEYAALLSAPDLQAYAATYPYAIEPVHDSRPFFFFTTRWSQLPGVFSSNLEDMKNNMGLFVLLVAAAFAGLGVVGLLLLPRWFGARERAASKTRWLYFLAIGVAYITVENALIQNLILFLGHPTYGIVAVVSSLLVGSGLGSRWSGRLRTLERGTIIIPLVLAGTLLALHLFLLPHLLAWGQPFSRLVRGVLAAAGLLPLGFLMGIPFPSGVRSAEASEGDILPWLWSANAAGSVFGSAMAVVLAINFGIPAAGAIGAACYLLAALSARLWPRPAAAVAS